MKTNFNISTMVILYKEYATAKVDWETNTAKSETIFNELYNDDIEWNENEKIINEALKTAGINGNANKVFIEKRNNLVDYVTNNIPSFKNKLNDSMIEIIIDFVKKTVSKFI